ncbi:NAD-dependent dehydratase [Saccharomonospora piscinae]|uniref:NAD-dependent dehydratase n=1 Tax=Saccharomonospora piscinae TaxID=687388 RepID=A0A1V9ABT3_SACPI|nr:NAD(P)-dependent oxidoreductase [Saccharomonospora piscinae]OQO94582.1 NAD-dependent dehydratase [Saccharomonospora piscinae]
MAARTAGERGSRVAITGAAGSLAGDILPGLRARGHRIVGIDRLDRPATAATEGVEWLRCDLGEADRLREAFTGCDAVVHLAGIPLESDWATISRVNIDGTQAVLEAARLTGAGRVVLASSIHAAGFAAVPEDGTPVPDDVPARPNTFYGVSKAALEALGSLYHDRYGLDVVCLRIASRFARPQGERMLATWLSPPDAVRLVDAALRTEAPGFRIVWGVSRNTRGYFSRAGGDAIGFRPEDDAEAYAEELLARAERDPSRSAADWDRRYLGGVFSSPEPPMFECSKDKGAAAPPQSPPSQPRRV